MIDRTAIEAITADYNGLSGGGRSAVALLPTNPAALGRDAARAIARRAFREGCLARQKRLSPRGDKTIETQQGVICTTISHNRLIAA